MAAPQSIRTMIGGEEGGGQHTMNSTQLSLYSGCNNARGQLQRFQSCPEFRNGNATASPRSELQLQSTASLE